ncbi:uncharacterized protein F5891DRAFT_50695 [Suillus fuscotomentosus]|uniref:Secreted protein n=1 Tax=Suillus fuscotomentosus TaxID=1912939 RepID=A0AAD4HD35_9AGAM|nr:uncharacterized protein F5891DRAFT_50695 [Suillus fuscotomentosus]KAG1893175.1 hypothetical protein F5891DRAFT_50695 [Suillus fuscotomentosus]
MRFAQSLWIASFLSASLLLMVFCDIAQVVIFTEGPVSLQVRRDRNAPERRFVRMWLLVLLAVPPIHLESVVHDQLPLVDPQQDEGWGLQRLTGLSNTSILADLQPSLDLGSPQNDGDIEMEANDNRGNDFQFEEPGHRTRRIPRPFYDTQPLEEDLNYSDNC